MPKIERKTHEINPDVDKDEDIIIESKGFRFYFQNFYNLISLANDLLTGLLYLVASVLTLIGFPSVYTTSLYLLGAVFLTFRPLIKIIHNTFLSKEQQGQTRSEKEAKGDLEDAEKNLEQAEKDREQAERDRQKAEKENAKKEKQLEEQTSGHSESHSNKQQNEEHAKTETDGAGESQGQSEEQRDENKEERDKAARERELEEKNRELNQEYTTSDSEESEQDDSYIKRLFTPASKTNQDKNQQDEDGNTNQ